MTPPCVGSSPLTRGKPCLATVMSGPGRLIPAHAGKTPPANTPRPANWAHPRSRGENFGDDGGRCFDLGSSPLTRGKRNRRRARPIWNGLIPAHAGKTFGVVAVGSVIPAHPRSRGENDRAEDATSLKLGSSPLTRGKPRAHQSHGGRCGLIPAHAGKTTSLMTDLQTRAAHPRSRGENRAFDVLAVGRMGSSPLTRGKLYQLFELGEIRGLIPAHAGKTIVSVVVGAGVEGSSPLTRGKHDRDAPRGRRLRAHPRSRGEN